MKKYIIPATAVQIIQYTAVLCASGEDSVTSDIGIHSQDKSGDVQNAF